MGLPSFPLNAIPQVLQERVLQDLITLVEPIVLYEKTRQLSKSRFLYWVKTLRHFTAWDKVPQKKIHFLLKPSRYWMAKGYFSTNGIK